MKKLSTLLFLIFLTIVTHAQIANDVMVGGGFDLLKTDNDGLFSKAQIGGEVNYFVSRTLTGTGGLEVWTDEKLSFVVGGRWYPSDNLFVRARGLIGVNDFSVGAGWSKPITDNLRFEAIGDFYFRLDFSARVGLAYVIRRKK